MTGSEQLTRLTSLLRQCPAVTGKPASAPLATPLPTTEAEWEQFIALAVAQKVGPLVAATLLAQTCATLPLAVAARLKTILAQSAQRSLLQFGELLRVQSRLRAEGIPMLFFKGQMLAQQAYGNLGLRSCFDLDIFVHQSDVLRVKPMLADLGYRPEFAFLPHQEADLLRMECEYPFIREDGAARIDLQWQPRARYFSFPVSAEALWMRNQRVRLQNFELDTFALADLLLLLVAHGAKHTWNKLEQVCALAALLHRHPGVDWAGLQQAARAAGAERMLWLAVSLVVTHFQAPVPLDLAARAAKDPQVAALTAELSAEWANPPRTPAILPTLRRHLRMRERLADRVRHCFWFAVTPTPGDWLALPLPPHLHWAHYLLRPGRLLCKHGRADQKL